MSIQKKITYVYKRFKWILLKNVHIEKILIENNFDFKFFIYFNDLSAPDYYYNKYEGIETNLIYDIVKPKMIVMDLGANLGFFTLLMGRLVGPEGQVHSFEPNPHIKKRLIENIKVNKDIDDGRITINDVALAANKGKTSFYCPIDGHEGFGGIKNTKRAPVAEKIKLNMDTLDNYVHENNIKKIDFIKMDIEGGELDVLKGADHILKVFKPIILFEGCELNTKPYGYGVSELLSYLQKKKYIIKKIDAENFISLPEDS